MFRKVVRTDHASTPKPTTARANRPVVERRELNASSRYPKNKTTIPPTLSASGRNDRSIGSSACSATPTSSRLTPHSGQADDAAALTSYLHFAQQPMSGRTSCVTVRSVGLVQAATDGVGNSCFKRFVFGVIDRHGDVHLAVDARFGDGNRYV